MPVATPSSPPSEIQAGDTLIFTVAEQGSDYPGADWAMGYTLAKDGIHILTANATWDGEKYTVTANAVDTAELQPGGYQYALFVSASSQRHTVQNGRVTVKANLAASRSLTDSETMLAALNAAILVLVADPNASASFNGQSYTNKNMGEMLKARDKLRATVAAERASLDGNPNWQTIHTRFC